MTDDREQDEPRITCTGCGAKLDRYATECSKCECSGCGRPIACCECGGRAKDEARAREFRQGIVDRVADYFSRWQSVADEAVPPLSEFADLIRSVREEAAIEAAHSVQEAAHVELDAALQDRDAEVAQVVREEAENHCGCAPNKPDDRCWVHLACDEILRRLGKEEK